MYGKNNTKAMFADDTTILSSKRKSSCSFQTDMDNLSQWFCQNRIRINRDKCEAVAFGRGHPSEILILNKKVSYSNVCKLLGLYVDKTLSFREHIDYVVKTHNKFCGLIYRVRHIFTQKCLLMFYNTFALSRNCYGLLIYSSAAKQTCRKVKKRNEEFCELFFSRRNLIPYMIFLERTKFEFFKFENIKELFRQLLKVLLNLS